MTKYRNCPIVVDGMRFDSKGEAARWAELQLLERAGEIRNLRRQVTYKLVVNGVNVCSMIPDFVYETLAAGGAAETVEDFKSPPTMTPAFRIKAKLFKALYGRDIVLNDGLPATARRAKVGGKKRKPNERV